MSLEKEVQDVVRAEVTRAVEPLTTTIAEAVVSKVAAALGIGAATALKLRRQVKAPKATEEKAVKVAKVTEGEKPLKEEKGASRLCALEGCGKKARSKGYCAAHYQKFHMLQKSGRLPADWVEFAPEGSVKNVTLPRGRAGAKALKEARTAA